MKYLEILDLAKKHKTCSMKATKVFNEIHKKWIKGATSNADGLKKLNVKMSILSQIDTEATQSLLSYKINNTKWTTGQNVKAKYRNSEENPCSWIFC